MLNSVHISMAHVDAARRARLLTSRELAARAGCSAKLLQRARRGERVDITKVRSICRVLGLRAADVVDRRDDGGDQVAAAVAGMLIAETEG